MMRTKTLLCAVALSVALGLPAQKVTVTAKNTKVETILASVAKQTGLSPAYSKQLLKTDRLISVDVVNGNLSQVLDAIVAGTNLVYEIKEKKIYFFEKRASSSASTPGVPKQISGTVVDERGEPVIGANVSVKGTTLGTITDIDGNFRLEVPSNGTLQVTYVGYLAQTAPVEGRSQFRFALSEDLKNLEEVVVIGYGTQKRVNVTGALSSVGGKELNNRVVSNPSSMLQGQLSGLEVTASSGEPGNEDVKMVLRGRGSFGGSLEPLIIVDGVPVSDMNAINPNAIESVTALKDAASCAIYGSRAAGGVLLITTKQGKEGREVVTFDANVGLNNAARLPELVTNSAEYMTLYNEAKRNRYGATAPNLYNEADIALYRNANGDPRYPNTHWLDQLFRTVMVQNYNVGISGGGQKSNHNITLGVIDQPGTMKGFEYRKYTLQANLNTHLSKRVQAGVAVRVLFGDRKGAGGSATSGTAGNQRYSQNIFNNTINQAPTYGPKLEDGNYVYRAFPNENPAQNPFVTLENTPVDQKTLRLETTAFLKVSFTDWLMWETRGGFNYTNSNTHSFSSMVMQSYWWDGTLPPRAQPASAGGDRGASDANSQVINPLLYTTLNFNKKWGTDHDLSAMVGYQMEYNRYSSFFARREEFLTNDAQQIDAGQQTKQYANGTASELGLMSYFGRVNYNYKGRYLVEVNARMDGSSRFSPDKRWGVFPSFSAAWRPFEEMWIPEVAWISDLKVRGSYGILGNQSVGDLYLYQQVLSPSLYTAEYTSHGGLVYAFDKSNPSQGFGAPKIVDPNLTWETTYSTNIGIDLSLFKNSLTFSVDYYNKRIEDILVPDAKLPYSSGFNTSVQALGSMRNRGMEFNLNYRGKVRDFTYQVGGYIYTNRNTVLDYPTPGPWGKQMYAPGYEYGAYFLNLCDGVRQQDEWVTYNNGKQLLPAGTLIIRDTHDAKSEMVYGMGTGQPDGIVTRNTDRVICKGAYPDFEAGLNLSAAWNGFDLAASFYGVFGVKQYVEGPGWIPFNNGIAAPSTMWRDAWTPENRSTSVPMIAYGDMGKGVWYIPGVENDDLARNTFSLLDGTYVRLKNLNVGYTFAFPGIGIQSLRVYFAGDNLFTITRFPGDPERQTGPYTSGTAAREFNNDFLRYPQNRIYSLGVSMKF